MLRDFLQQTLCDFVCVFLCISEGLEMKGIIHVKQCFLIDIPNITWNMAVYDFFQLLTVFTFVDTS